MTISMHNHEAEQIETTAVPTASIPAPNGQAHRARDKRPDPIDIPVADVVFREKLYPRIETSAQVVQKYAEDLTVLPPIEVNQHFELIDGWHRWTAHKKNKADTIPAIITQTDGDGELLEFAIERNAKHGLQLSQNDKRDMARKIYNETPDHIRDVKKKHLAKILSVSERTVREWLARIDQDAKAARDWKIFEMWMSCRSQEEIAEAVGCNHATVTRFLDNFVQNGELAESHKPAAFHQTEFETPIYNVWKQQEKSKGSNHFGNTEARWLDNLLYLYTQPFGIVVDPFAGGGSTIDVCRHRFRRYWVSDRKPVPEREHQIRKHDLVADGIPKLPRWQDVQLVYLDPPYWKQAEGKYSTDETDLANMPLDQFTESLAEIIRGFAKKLAPGALIALMMQPTQWNAPEHTYTDHVAHMIRAVKLPIDLRVQCPYESQQCNPQMVEWAKANRKVLVLSRELVIWRI